MADERDDNKGETEPTGDNQATGNYDGGATGGEQEKVEACRENGTIVLVVKRPFVDYGTVYNEIDDLMKEFR